MKIEPKLEVKPAINTIEVKEGVTMALTWKTIGHAFASSFSAVAKGANYLLEGAQKVENAAPVVEKLTALVPVFGAQAAELEQVAFAGLGLIIGGLHYGGDAFKQNLLDNGADEDAITAIKAIIAKYPSIVADVEAVFGKPTGTVPPVPIPSGVTATPAATPIVATK